MEIQKRNVNSLTIVVSVYNEEDVLENFLKKLLETIGGLSYACEVIMVNDGSVDSTPAIIESQRKNNPNLKAIHFSRNFGHEAAMLAGIDNSSGDVIICMDADLQHPPEKIVEMVQEYENGADIVNMKRADREDGKFIKKVLSKLFYKIINKISPVNFEENATDFFLISSRVGSILKHNYRERARFLRGFIQILGFRRSALSFSAPARFGGESKYSMYRLFILSLGAVVSFSKLPLHLGIVVGIVFSLFSIVVGAYSIIMKFTGEAPPGYTTLVVFMSFSFSIMFFLIGIIGVYIGYNFDENKKRPLYIVNSKEGFNE